MFKRPVEHTIAIAAVAFYLGLEVGGWITRRSTTQHVSQALMDYAGAAQERLSIEKEAPAGPDQDFFVAGASRVIREEDPSNISHAVLIIVHKKPDDEGATATAWVSLSNVQQGEDLLEKAKETIGEAVVRSKRAQLANDRGPDIPPFGGTIYHQ